MLTFSDSAEPLSPVSALSALSGRLLCGSDNADFAFVGGHIPVLRDVFLDQLTEWSECKCIVHPTRKGPFVDLNRFHRGILLPDNVSSG